MKKYRVKQQFCGSIFKLFMLSSIGLGALSTLANAPAEKTADKSTDKSAEKSADKSAEKSAEKLTDEPIEIRIKDHKFFPDLIKVKANQRFKVKVINEDPTSEEFESNTMIVEKFIGPKRTMVINLGPLKPGTYEFFGELNLSTAQGKVIAE